MRILDSKCIQYELIDISVGGELRNEMRNKAGDPSAAPPQLFNEDQYCGVRTTTTRVYSFRLLQAVTTDLLNFMSL